MWWKKTLYINIQTKNSLTEQQPLNNPNNFSKWNVPYAQKLYWVEIHNSEQAKKQPTRINVHWAMHQSWFILLIETWNILCLFKLFIDLCSLEHGRLYIKCLCWVFAHLRHAFRYLWNWYGFNKLIDSWKWNTMKYALSYYVTYYCNFLNI